MTYSQEVETLLKEGKIPENLLQLIIKSVEVYNPVVKVPGYNTFDSGVKKLLHPELLRADFVGYNFSVDKLRKWVHPEQDGCQHIPGSALYSIVKKRYIGNCLSFDMLLAIMRRGRPFYDEYFGENYVLAWKSIFVDNDGLVGVPSLCGSHDGYREIFSLGVEWLHQKFNSHMPVYYFSEI